MIYDLYHGNPSLIVLKVEQLEERIVLHVSMPLEEHQCTRCHRYTKRVHDYRILD